jgi:hypothetical protein
LLVARAEFQRLESMTRRRIELRPQISLFSFSNPVLLAANLGSSLLFSRSNAPSAFSLLNARLDMVAADWACRRRKVRAELETARRFFELMERQETSGEVCSAMAALSDRARLIKAQVGAGRATAIDEIRQQQAMIDRETACVQAEADRVESAAQLAAVLGFAADSDVRVVPEPDWVADLERPLASAGDLAGIGIARRGGAESIRRELTQLRTEIGSRPKSGPQLFSLTYSRIHNSAGSAIGSSNNLLGGNMLSPEIAWSAVLRDNGQAACERRLLEAKLRKVEQELELMEEELRAEVASQRQRVTAAAKKLVLARRRAELAARTRTLVAARFQLALESEAALYAAEQEEQAARSQVARAAAEASAGYFAVLAACGIQSLPFSERSRLLYAVAERRAQ